MKISLLSLGCKVNQAEFNEIGRALVQKGAEIVSLDEKPDFCVINTCSVTSKSDYQSRQIIRRAAQSGTAVIVTGCYAELNPESVREMKGVLDVIPNKNKERIINRIAANISSDKSNPCCFRPNRTRYFIKIQDGCNAFCSYCLIPKARGRARSFKPADIVDKVKRAVSEGYKEVVLTGIHIGMYGSDLEPRLKISTLVLLILEKTSIERVRLSSLEVNELEEDLIELMRGGRLCNHLHIPIQSGDDRILKAMNRPYKVKEYMEKVLLFAENMPDMGIGTDVIVGFPGEGEMEFANTMETLKNVPFTYIHVFPYSERTGTKAVEMPGKVRSDVKKFRVAALRSLSDEKKNAFLDRMVSRDLQVLIEEDKPDGCLGTASNYIKALARFPQGVYKGNIVRIRIEGHNNGIAFGKPLFKT